MKVLLVNTYDTGGAANACIRLHHGLSKLTNITSQILFLHSVRNDICQKYTYTSRSTWKSRLKDKMIRLGKEFHIISNGDKFNKEHYLKGRSNEFDTFSFANTPYNILDQPIYINSDIIHLHWVSDFLDYPSFFAANKKPLVWTLHDMNSFTGGCHYNGGCDRFLLDCFPCPQLNGTINNALAATNLAIKLVAMNNLQDLVIVSPSQWLSNQAKKSRLFKNLRHEVIPYGVDENIFKPVDKAYARNILDLPQDKKIILFMAESLGKTRKGLHLLLDAMQQIDIDSFLLLTVGKGGGLNNINNIIEIGNITNERFLKLAYSAADIFVLPSLEDNLPNTIIESLMCGTPVIGFPIGGVIDLINRGENGYICNEITSKSLKETIELFFKTGISLTSEEIQEKASVKYSLLKQAEYYQALYQDLMIVRR